MKAIMGDKLKRKFSRAKKRKAPVPPKGRQVTTDGSTNENPSSSAKKLALSIPSAADSQAMELSI